MRPAVALGATRVAWGAALTLAPGRVIALFDRAPHGRADLVVARVLGARHLVQATISAAARGRTVRRLGAAVDGVHAGTAAGLAAIDVGHRRLALLDAAIASGFCVAGFAIPEARR